MIFAPLGERVRIREKKCIIESRIGPYQGVISNMKKKYIYIYISLTFNKFRIFFILISFLPGI